MGLFSYVPIILVTLLVMSPAFAHDVTLQWDANTEPDIAGYKIYYNADTGNLPFVGTGSVQGVSPVDVGNLTTATLSGLDPARSYYFAVTAYDTSGYESSFSNIVSSAEGVPPVVVMTSPTGGATVSGKITVSATATDNSAVTNVELYVDGTMVSALPAAPYVFTYDTQALSNGTHTVTIRAYDAAGNAGDGGVTVQVVNDKSPPVASFKSPVSGATVSGTVAVAVDATDDVGVTSVAFLVDGLWREADMTAPFAFSWDSTTSANGTHTLFAMAFDAAGNSSQVNVAVIVANDTVPPKVAITAPAAGASIAGNITLSATASDNMGVSSVAFLVDGALIGTVSSAPYALAWNSTSVANGSHTIAALAYDAVANSTKTQVTITVANDTTPPMVSISSPAAGTTVSGSATVTATASDNVGVTKVEFYVGGVLQTTDTAAPFSFAWNTKAIRNGTYSVTAIAYDARNNMATSSAVAVTVFNDTTAPTVSITAPTAGSKVGGTSTVIVAAADDVGVSKVEFYVDGTLAGMATAAPYSFSWNTRTATNAAHAVTAKAYDAAGNVGTSAAINVTVFNDTAAPTVSVTSPAVAATVSGTVTVTASAVDNVAVTKVEFFVDDVLKSAATAAPYSYNWNSKAATNGVHSLTAVAYDAVGNVAISTTVYVTVFNDVTAPSVSVIAPAAAATVSGTVSVTAAATDNVAVSKVVFYLDGILAGTSTAGPYSFSWNTKTATNAAHILSAKAFDAAGNIGTSAAVTITVFNDTTAPAVSVTAPAAGVSVSGTVSVAAGAADNVAVTKVEFYVNGVLQSTDTAAPYSFAWDTTKFANGPAAITAKAYDAAENSTVSTAANVSIFNDTAPPTAAITSSYNDNVRGTQPITAIASDNVGVVKVEFYVNNTLKFSSATAPYSYSWETRTAPNGINVLVVKAYDAAGNVGTSAAVNVTVFNDTAAPTVSVISPAAAATVSGTVTVTASAADNVAVTKVEFFVDDVLKSAAIVAPYSYNWNSKAATNGVHSLTAVAYDAVGNVAISTTVYVTVFNDVTAPTASITAPAAGVSVSGTVSVAAGATDNVAVTKVEFYVDSTLKYSSFTAPYSYSWDTRTVPNGINVLVVKAYDAAGLVGVSAPVSVNVYNGYPSVSITSPSSGSKYYRRGGAAGKALDVATMTVPVAVDAVSEPGIAQVELYADDQLVGTLDSAPFVFSWDTTNVNGMKKLHAKAYDVAGNIAESAAVDVLVGPDITPPSIKFTAPVARKGVTGIATVRVAAKDPGGIARVDLFIDGAIVPYASVSTTKSFSFRWDTSAFAPGPHVLRAVAYDLIGNFAEATETVIVKDVVAPVVAVDPLPDSAPEAGVLNIIATATDNVGVVNMKLYIDGKLKETAGSGSISYAWDLTGVRSGRHRVTVVASDAAGKSSKQTVTWDR